MPLRTIIFILSCLLLNACVSTTGGYNPTTYQYRIDNDAVKNPETKTLILATTNLAKPSRTYVQEYEPMIDRYVTRYLEKAGYTVLPSYHFNNAWAAATRRTGATYDPTTGKLDNDAHLMALKLTMEQLAQETQAGAILFTDLMERQIAFNQGLNHNAQWDGVTRRLPKMGNGDGVPVGFDWNAPVEAVSLWLNLFDLKTTANIFSGLAGIDSMEAINLKLSEPRFTRKRNLFNNEDFIEEAVTIAFHPLIPMKGYPGDKD